MCATLIAPRIFTAGADFTPQIILRTSSGETEMGMEPDDQFLHSIVAFEKSIDSSSKSGQAYAEIRMQARLQTAIARIGDD